MNKFNPTHRVLVKATESNHCYETIILDIKSGMFKRDLIKQQLTTIRVKENILAEVLCCNGNKPLNNNESLDLINKFNSVRVKAKFNPISFERIENANQ